MAQYLPLPDGNSVTIREGETPRDAWKRAMQMYPDSFAVKTPEESPKSGFMPALKAGVSSLKEDVAGLAGRAGLMDLPAAEKYIAEQKAYQKKTFAPTQEGFLEAPLTKIGELAGGSLPYMVAPAAAAFLAPEGLAAAGAAGLASAGQFTGSNITRQMETGKKLGETDVVNAALAALPQAALDTVSLGMIPGMGKMFGKLGFNISEKAAQDLAKEGLKKTVADYALTTGKTMGVEGLTEASQQVFERMQAGLSITDPEARKEYFDNFLGGAVLGGILAPVGRRMERGAEQGRFDKQQREDQKTQAAAAKAEQDRLDAASLAAKQTPEYALQAQQAYLDAEKRKAELEAQVHRAPKGEKLTEDQKQDNRETQQALKEHADVLKEANKEYRLYRQFLPKEPAPAPEAIKDTEQLQQVDMFGNLPVPKAPELDLQGKPLERTETAEDVLAREKQRSLYGPESQQAQLQQTFDMYDATVGNRGKFNAPETLLAQNDPRQQARMLEQLVAQYQNQLQDASPQEILALAPQYAQANAALAEARKAVEAMPKPVEAQLAKLHQKLGVAKEKGDVPAAAKLSQSILELEQQAVPPAQQAFEMQPFKATTETIEQMEARKAKDLEEQRQKAQQATQAESDAYVNQRIRERRTQRKLDEMNAPAPEQPQRDEELRHIAEKETIDRLLATLPTGSIVTPGQIMMGLGGEQAHLRDLQTQLAIANVTRNKELIGALNEQIADVKAGQEERAKTSKPIERLPALGEGKLPESRAKEAEAEQHADKQSEMLQAFVAQLQKIKLRPDTADVSERVAKVNKAREAAGKPPITLADQSATMLDTARAAYLKSHLDEIEARRAAFGLPPMADWEIGEARARVMEAFNELQNRWGQAVPKEAPAGQRQFGAPVGAVASLQDQMRTNIYQNVASAAERMLQNTQGTMKEKTVQRSATPTFERDESGQLRQTGYARPTGPQPVTPNLNLREQPRLPEDDKQHTLDMIDQVLNNLETRTTAVPTQANKAPEKVKSLADIARLMEEETSGQRTAKTDAASIELLHQLRDTLPKTSNKEFVLLAREQVQRIMEGNLPNQYAVRELGEMLAAQKEGRRSETAPGAVLSETTAQPQKSLFPETEVLQVSRATPENFQKLLDSKNVQGMREAIAQQKADNQAALQSVLDNIQPAKTAAQKAEEALNKAKEKAAPLLKSAAKERGEPEWHAPAIRKVMELETALQSIPPRLKLLKDIREKIAGLNEDQKLTLLKQVNEKLNEADKNKDANAVKELFELKQALLNNQPLSKEINRLTAVVRLAKKTIDKARADLNSLVEQHVGDKTIRDALLAQADKATEKIDKLTKAFEEAKKQEASEQIKPVEEKPTTEATPMKTWRGALQRGREGLDLPGVRNLRDMTALKQKVLGIRQKMGSFDAQIEKLQDPKRKLSEKDKEKLAELQQKRSAATTELDAVYENAPTITTEIKEEARLALEKSFDDAQARAYDLVARKRQEKAGEIPSDLPGKKQGPTVTELRTGRVSESGVRTEPTARVKAAQEALSTVAKVRSELRDLQDRMQYLRDNGKDKKSGRYTDVFKGLQAQETKIKSALKEAEAAANVVAANQKEVNAALASARKKVEEAKTGKEALALKEAEETRQAEATSGPAVFRTKTREGAGLKEKTIERIANEVTKGWAVVPEIEIVADESGLPENIQRQAKRDNMIGKIPGVYDTETKKVYLVAQNLFDANDVALTIAHEIAGHFGLREMLGSTYPKIMNYIYNGNADVRRAANSKMDGNKNLSREVAVEEVLAEIAEQGPQAGKGFVAALRQVVYAIKQMLAKLGIFKVSDDEVNQIVANARRYVQEGVGKKRGEAPVGGSNANFNNWFGNSKVTGEDGAPLILFHGSASDKIEAFDPKRIGESGHSALGRGFYAGEEWYAREYNGADTKSVTPLYARIEHPLYFGDERFTPELPEADAANAAAYEKVYKADPALARAIFRLRNDRVYGIDSLAAGFDRAMDIAGIDGVIDKQIATIGPNKGKPYVHQVMVRDANQFKHARANTGTFSRENNAILYRTKADYKSDDALTKLAKKAVAQDKTWKERAGSHIGLKLEMDAVDMRAGVIKALNNAVEDPRTMGSTKLFRQAIFSITAADQNMATTQMALSSGPPEMRKDEKGYYTVASSMKNDAGQVFDAVQDIPDSYGDTQAKMGLASVYMIAQRALNKGLKKLDLGALGVTEQELQDAMAAAKADPKLGNALENVRSKYNAFNRGMIEWLSSPQVAAISQADAKAYLKDEDYVPYYRVRPDGTAELVFGGEKTITIGDIRHQPYLAELKGGEAQIMPLDKSIMRNTMLLVTKGMNNMAMKNVAYAMQAAGDGLGPIGKNGKPTNLMPINVGKGPDQANVIRWTQEPDPKRENDKGDRWLRVETNDTLFGGIPAELIVKSLDGAHLTLPAFLKWGGIAGDLLRAGVTRTPIYLARQLFRDPFAATATSGLDYGPITAIFKANKEFLKITTGQSETGAKLIEKGLLQSGIFEGDVANMSKIALQLASGKSQGIFDKMLARADRWALQADAATRALIYDNAIKNGLSEAEADHAVRESMNFSKRGLSPTVQYASRMIPFFNAQMQGLNVLVKAATGNMPAEDVLKIKRKFANNAMMLTGFGIAYAMAMDDDDYYKNAKPKDRYTNFFVPLPGVDEPLKLPIPYEFGFFFSAGVALADAIKGEVDTPQQLRALKDMFVGAIPGASSNFVPQLVKPLAEVYANKSFFSDTPLESARLEKLKPEARYNAHTTEVAKWMATMVPGLSPIQIEHIVTGYLGQMPLMVLASTNEMFRDGKEEPARKLSEMPLIGSSFQRKYGGEDADVVYKLANDSMEAKRTFDNYRKTGKLQEAKDFLADNRAEIAVAPMAAQYQKIMGALRKQEEIIRGSNMPADKKQERIDQLDAQRQLQSERYLKAIRKAEAAGGRTTPQ